MSPLQLGKVRTVDAITLQAMLIKSRNAHVVTDKRQRIKKCGIGVVPLHRAIGGGIVLAARDAKGQLILPLGGDAKGTERRQGQIYVGSALKGRQDPDDAILITQGKCQQKSRDKLAAHVATKGDVTAVESSLHGQRGLVIMGLPQKTLVTAQLGVNIQRTRKQAGCAAKGRLVLAQKADGNKKSQGAAAFTAGKRKCGTRLTGIDTRDLHHVARFLIGCAQPRKNVQRCQHILGVRNARDAAFATCKPRTNEHSVPHAFGGGRRNRPLKAGRIDLNFHVISLFLSTDPSLQGSRRFRDP